MSTFKKIGEGGLLLSNGSDDEDGEGERDVFGGESYALLDRDESWEDAGVQIRRRRPVAVSAGGT